MTKVQLALEELKKVKEEHKKYGVWANESVQAGLGLVIDILESSVLPDKKEEIYFG